MKPTLCVVLHDVASTTLPACERVMHAVTEVAAVPMTLLTVPRYHCEPSSAAFGRWLQERHSAGDELALHGYTHQDEGVPRNFIDHLKRHHYTRGEGEFCDLSVIEATRRLTAGMRWFARQGLPLRGFVAPAWLMSEGSWQALRWQDLRYTCTLRRLVLLPEMRAMTSQSIVYSSESPWRRQASLAWNAAVATTLRHNPLLRLELHPQDADHAGIRRSWQGLLEKHLQRRRATTLADAAEQFRIESDWDLLGSGMEFEETQPEESLHDHEHELGGEPADHGADGDIARVVEPEHHP